jgi:hypothetical protein
VIVPAAPVETVKLPIGVPDDPIVPREIVLPAAVVRLKPCIPAVVAEIVEAKEMVPDPEVVIVGEPDSVTAPFDSEKLPPVNVKVPPPRVIAPLMITFPAPVTEMLPRTLRVVGVREIAVPDGADAVKVP